MWSARSAFCVTKLYELSSEDLKNNISKSHLVSFINTVDSAAKRKRRLFSMRFANQNGRNELEMQHLHC